MAGKITFSDNSVNENWNSTKFVEIDQEISFEFDENSLTSVKD
jgi:hypothetical protein